MLNLQGGNEYPKNILDMIKIFLTFLLFVNLPVFGQEDSIIVNKMSDNFIEIKTLRHKLFNNSLPGGGIILDSTIHNPGTYAYQSLVPSGPVLKNGMVVIRDRNDNLLGINYYKDSIRVMEEHYSNNKLTEQFVRMSNDSVLIDKYFFKESGNTEFLSIMIGSDFTEIEYFMNGQIKSFNKRKLK